MVPVEDNNVGSDGLEAGVDAARTELRVVPVRDLAREDLAEHALRQPRLLVAAADVCYALLAAAQ